MFKPSWFIIGLSVLLICFYLYVDLFGKNSSPKEEQNKNSENKYDVIIVGAGMAGVAAGDHLRNKGYNVILLEARNRAGGRVWTDRSFGFPLELGAGWIQGSKHNPLAELAKKYHLKTTTTDLEDFSLYDPEGKPVSSELMEELESSVEKFHQYMAEQQEERTQDVPVAQIVSDFIRKEKLTGLEAMALRHAITLLIEGDYGAGIEQLSLLEFDQDLDLAGDDLILPQGYDQIIKNLGEKLQIAYEKVVTDISYNNQGVTVQTKDGVYKADYAICTVPLGVLKRDLIKFSPNLPLPKQQAIQKLGMGITDKIYLKFPSVFWKKDKDSNFIGYLSGSVLWTGFLNFYKYIKEPVLLVFNPGKSAQDLENMSDEQIVSSAMEVLHTIYGKDIPNPSGYLITRWAKDPYSFGSYSYVAIGATANDYDVMAQPVNNRLFFAGEATNRKFPALVHGAYWSGTRAAEEIVKLKK